MLTLLKAALIVTVVGVCGCNKRKNITSPERLQRDVLDDYDIQPQSLFGSLPSTYNQPTRNRDPFESGLLPSRGGYGQLNNYGRQYGNRPFPWGGQIHQSKNTDNRLHDESEETRSGFHRPQILPPSYWRLTPNYGGTVRPLPLRNTDYRLYEESEETRGRFRRPQVLPSSNWRPISNYGMSPGQYRPQQQNSQPIAPYYYSALPLKGSSIGQSDRRLPYGSINLPRRPSTIYQPNTPYIPSGYYVDGQHSLTSPETNGYHQLRIVPLLNGKTAVMQKSANGARNYQSQSVSFDEDNDLTLLQAEASTQLDDISNDNSKPNTQFKPFNEAVEPALPRAQPAQSLDVAKDDTVASTHSQTADEIVSTQSDVVTKDDGTANDGVKVGLKSEDVESTADQSSLRKLPAPVPEDDIPKTAKADLDSTSRGSIVSDSSPNSPTSAVHDPAAKSVEKADNDPAPRSDDSEDASTATQA